MKVKKAKNRMVRTQIQLTQGQVDDLKSLSAEKGGSMAAWIRKGVDIMIREAGGLSFEERRKRALEAVGIGRSESDDIAENHDAYLEEIYLERKP
jgi:hypothetical protein